MGAPLRVNWAEIRRLREMQGITYQELADKFGVKLDTICQRAHRERWNNPGRAVDKAVMKLIPTGNSLAAAQERVSNEATRIMVNAIEGLVSDAVKQARGIMDLSHNAVLTAENPRDLLMAAKSWEVGHNGARKALGLDSPTGQGATAWSGQSALQAASGIVLDAEEVVDTPNTPVSTPENASNPEQSNVG